jgi:hypothetical protein
MCSTVDTPPKMLLYCCWFGLVGVGSCLPDLSAGLVPSAPGAEAAPASLGFLYCWAEVEPA